ncbi:MAG: endonuclease VII domain-containing protein [Burkholderiales bacterium]
MAYADPERLKEYNKQYYADNRDAARNRHFKSRYGITLEERDAMLAAQEGCCAACRTALSDKWVIDHCHTTGRIRGLLCQPCNLILGHARDSTEKLRCLIVYLEK